MSSSNSAARLGSSREKARPRSPSAQIGERIVGGDEAGRPQLAPAPAGGSAACRASGGRAGPRRDRRPCRSGRRAGRSRPAAGRASAGPSASSGCCSQSATCVGQRASSFVGSASMARTPSARIGRERELAAGIDRDLRRVVGGAGGDHLVLADALEAEDQPGEEEGVAGRQRLDEVLLDLAERRARRARRSPAPRVRATRTFRSGASTMVPTLSRYCWATARMGDAPEAVRARAGSWRSARRSSSA